ncbi:MAG: alpha-amylase, partial [Deltaproteobacteria bacterium]|nr:alpha-amylase [Deltaproteobacteria bacterium]
MSPVLPEYFPLIIQLAARAQDRFALQTLLPKPGIRFPMVLFYRRLAAALGKSGLVPVAATAAQLNLYASLLKIYRFMIDELAGDGQLNLLADALKRSGINPAGELANRTFETFKAIFPPGADLSVLGAGQQNHLVLRELLLLDFASKNRAVEPFRILLDDYELAALSPYRQVVAGLEKSLLKGPILPGIGMTLVEALQAPLKFQPESLAGQLEFIREQWADLLPSELLEEVLTAFDLLEEEQRQWSDGGPGPSEVLSFSTHVNAIKGDVTYSKGIAYHGAGHHAGY